MMRRKIFALFFALAAGVGISWAATVNPLPGKFSVSAEQVVYFSRGNLQATTADNGTTWTWAFAANQYDCIGNATANTSINGNGTVSTNGTVDLFGWSTAATTYGIHNSTTAGDYSGDFVDWGGNIGTGWRTLTSAEWTYLLNTRSGTTVNSTGNARFTKAAINTDGTEVKGLILFPDDYDGSTPSGVTWGTINGTSNGYTTRCTEAGWTALEGKNCVFLPAAGGRYGTNVSSVGSYGRYWSATLSDATYAYYLFFLDSDLDVLNFNRGSGSAVRLVTETAPAADPLADAQAVKALIDFIGEVTYPDSKDAIDAARAAYDALSDEAKALIEDEDLAKLTAAEAAYAAISGGGSATPIGAFTVADGTVVYFSQGNLQYQASTETWRFAENQYDLIGSDNSNISASYTGWIDLFGWGVAATDPAKHTTTNSDYLNSVTADGAEMGSANDWGTVAAGDLGTGWRTLTSAEWDYLFNTRTYAATLRARATVHSVPGLIILPDGCTPAVTLTTTATDFTTNGISDSNWSSLEAQGAVFLPAAGYRDGSSVGSVSSSGNYWSSTSMSSDIAYFLNFNESSLSPQNNYYRRGGHSVRLVTETALNPSGTCGESLTWEFTLPDSALVISGTGAMTNFGSASLVPWYDYRTAIKSVTLPNGLANIGDMAFFGCSKLASADVPASVTRIGDNAFNSCAAMTSIEIPNSVTDIGDYAFQYCTGLTSVTNNATAPQSINTNVFGGVSMSNVTLHVLSAYVATYAAADVWKDFTILVGQWISGGTTCTLYDDGSFVVAPTDGESGAMADYSINTEVPWKDYVADIKTVNLQSGVTSIGTNAFNGCTKLTSIEIPYSVTKIGNFVFYQCYTLVSVEIPNSVTSIGADAFYQCSSLTSVTIPNSVTRIGMSTFYGCTKLTSVTIPNSVTSIGMQAFKGCTKLTSVTIPNSVTSIGTNAFNGCTKLTSVTNNATTPQSINTNVFDGLTLSNITLFVPEASVEAYAAADVWKDFKIALKQWISGGTTCTLYDDGSFVVAPTDGESGAMADYGLGEAPWYGYREEVIKTLTIQPGVTHIGNDAFVFCQSLNSVSLPGSITSIGSEAFAQCESLSAIEIPTGVVSIGAQAFSGCESLTSIEIPNSVESIGKLAFLDCKVLTSMTIGSGVTGIGEQAFYYCIALTSITNNATAPQTINANVFGGVSMSNVTLHVPSGSEAAYKAAEVWQDFFPLATLSTAPTAKTLTYNGAAQTLITAGTAEGGTIQYSLNGTSWSTDLPQATNAEDYTVHYRVIGDANHTDVAEASLNVTIAKAALTITAEDKSVIYGDAVPEYTASFDGWKNNDNEEVVSGLTLTSEYAPTSSVGEYAIIPSGATATNYAITFVNGKVTVNKAALTITAEDKSVTYGDAAPTYTASYEGWKNSDNASVITGMTLTSDYAPTSDVGEYTITPSGASATNYAITFVNGKVTVNKAALTITAEDKSVTYGDAAPTYTASYEGWKNSDNASVITGMTLTSEYAPTSDVGDYAIVPANATATNYAISFVNGKVTVNKAALTITAEDKSVIYGDAVPEYTASYSGFVNGEGANVVTGLTFACNYAPTSSVGEYTIIPANATATNYDITFVNGKVTVGKAALTITAEDKSVIYGDAVPEYTASYDGWQNGDNASVVSGLTLTSEYAPTSSVGEYAIIPSGATATNYAITFVNGKVTVNKAALTITAEDKSVIYGDAAPTYTASYSGFKNSDDEEIVSGLTLTSEYAPTSDVGDYAIVPANATALNYAITFVNGKVTVEKAALTITADNKEVEYGEEAPAFTATYEGWKNSDDASVVTGLTLTCNYAPTSNVGEYTIVPANATATNYDITFVNGKVTVNKAALTITADNKSVTYSDAVPEYSATYDGWKNSDNESVVTGLSLTSEYAPTSNVGDYAIVPANATATNYAITFVNGKVTVNKAALTITADNKSVEYGDAVPTYTASYDGWKNSDNEEVVSGLTLTCNYAPTSNVGEYTIVPANATATNYAITFVNGKVTVNKAALTITANDETVTYGDAAPTYTASFYGWKNSDNASVVTGLTLTSEYAPTSDVGDYAIVPANATALNYAITFVNGKVTVEKAALTITADNKEVEYGEEAPAFTASYSGWKNSDNASVVTGLTLTSEYAPTSDVGDYAIVPANATALNYAITFVNGKVTVEKAALTITADNKEVEYGEEAPAFTATYEGWKNSDDASVVSGLTLTSEYAPTSDVGDYAIVPANATATNYAITFVNGKVTVNKAALTITAEDKSVIYGDAVPEYSATYDGWKNSDNASVLTGLTYDCAYAPTSNVGDYAITPSGATATNYAITFINGKVTVNKAVLTITANDETVTYGDAAPTYTASYSGFKNSDDEEIVSGLTLTSEYAPTSDVGDYAIVPANATATNYAITFVNGKVTVNKAALTITAEDKSVIYGDAVPTYTASYDGWKNSDDASVITGLTLTSEYAPTSSVGEYAIVPANATATNYDITFVNGKVTVGKAALTITANDETVTYGDAAPTYTASFYGWKNSDNASVVTGLTLTSEYAPTSDVGDYAIVPANATALNYAITFVNGKVTVEKAALTITADNKEVEYGEEAPAFTATYEGWKNSDDASVVSGLTLTSEYAPTSDVGDYAIVPANATAFNYDITFVNGKVTVGKAALTITADNKSVEYGDEAPTYTASYDGWKNSDDASVVSGLTLTCNYAPTSNVGDYTIIPSGAAATNYAISYVNGTLTVNKANAAVSVHPSAISGLTYNSAAQTLVTAGTAVGGMMEYRLGTIGEWSTTLPDASNADTYAVYYRVVPDGNHTAYEAAEPVNITIAPREIAGLTMVITPQSVSCSGSLEKPESVIVTDSELGYTLVEDTDYTLTNNGGVNTGTYPVTATGTGNYTGTLSGEFVITGYPVNRLTTALEFTTHVYTGDSLRPTVTVTRDNEPLTLGTDYTLRYENNRNAGTASVTIIGVEPFYQDETTLLFFITPKPLDETMITVDQTLVFTGEWQQPEVTVSDGTALTADDYSVQNNGGIHAGEYSVKVIGLNNYTGSITATYPIARAAAEDIAFDGIANPVVGELLDSRYSWLPADETAQPNTVYTVVLTILADNDHYFAAATAVTVNGENAEVEIAADMLSLTATYAFPATARQITEEGLQITVISEDEQTAVLDDVTVTTGQTELYIPDSIGGYAVVAIADSTFADLTSLTDVYMPDTEEPIAVGEGTFPETVRIHTPLALLDDYALMLTLNPQYAATRIMTTVTVNTLWTLGLGCDVIVPDGVEPYTVEAKDAAAVRLSEIPESQLLIDGYRVIRANNGVLMSGNAGTYDLYAYSGRIPSGSFIATGDNKDYGTDNRLEPVIEDTHYDAGAYYVLSNNAFRAIRDEGEEIKVPAGKAVLHLDGDAADYGQVMQIINRTEGTEEVMAKGEWANGECRKVLVNDVIYILRGDKVYTVHGLLVE